MKVKEIIEALEKFDPNTEIGLKTSEGIIKDYCIKIELNNEMYFSEWDKDN